MPVITVRRGNTSRIAVQIGLDIKRDSISKISNTKRVGGMAQIVKNLPSRC
jgi:hypothetical protein